MSPRQQTTKYNIWRSFVIKKKKKTTTLRAHLLAHFKSIHLELFYYILRDGGNKRRVEICGNLAQMCLMSISQTCKIYQVFLPKKGLFYKIRSNKMFR